MARLLSFNGGSLFTQAASTAFLDCLIQANSDYNQDEMVKKNLRSTDRYANLHSCHSSATKHEAIKGLFLGALHRK